MSIELNEKNYYTQETDVDYMSFSQMKDFMECPAKALAIVEKRFVKETTDAMLQGSYIDAYFSGEAEAFKAEHPDIINKRTGELLAKFQICEDVIKSIEEDKGFREALYRGNAQTILTGTIAGVPFKGKLDFLQDDKIIDMKAMRSIEDVWSDTEHKYVPFWRAYRYDLQAAIYRELVRQATGKELPYYLAVATKENPSKHVCYRFGEDILKDALTEVEQLAPKFDRYKKHLEEAPECGHCDYYWSTHEFDMTFDVILVTKENN